MTETAVSVQFLVLFFGIFLVVNIFLQMGLKKIGIPSLIGFILIGLLLSWGDNQWQILSREASDVLNFLSEVGLFTLLFRVGLESNLKGLLKQMRHASLIWLGNVIFSGLLGYVVSVWLLRLEIIPSLFIGVALTATSVGVSISVWQEQNAIRSPTGELLLDVAEMDDISGILLMVLLLSVVSGIHEGGIHVSAEKLTQILGSIFLKLLVFGALCVLFSRFIEEKVTGFFARKTHSPEPMIVVAGLGFVIAGIGALLGFSLAMGAFFAGLVFSRDPKAVNLDASFSSIYEIFYPFFFIGIGLSVNLRSLAPALKLGGVLILLAVLGKLIGNGILSLAVTDAVSALLISVSMIPRAEIAMIIMKRGNKLGDWAVPDKVFSAMVLVSLTTCLISPLILRKYLMKWPQKTEGS
jgi:Kef-type K+ transport system membrane component KefB